MTHIAILIVAAGSSSRLGEPKQLIFKEKDSLLQSVGKMALVFSNTVICIVGFEAEKVSKELIDFEINCIKNEKWRQGMGSSIACGIKALGSDIDAIVILTCDQWAITPIDLESLITRWRNSPNNIIASQYRDLKTDRNVIGVPAIFPKYYFRQLSRLKKHGARKIIVDNLAGTILVELNNATYDLDTKEDLQEYISKKANG